MIFIEMDWLIIWGTVLGMCSISIVICYKCLRTFTLMRGMKQKVDISAFVESGYLVNSGSSYPWMLARGQRIC